MSHASPGNWTITLLALFTLALPNTGCQQDSHIGTPRFDADFGADAGGDAAGDPDAKSDGVTDTDTGVTPRDADRNTRDTGADTDSERDASTDTAHATDTGFQRPDTDLGKSCDYDRQCESGACLDDQEFPGGHCDSNEWSCDINDCRRAGGRCVQKGNWGTYCAPRCADSLRDCRPGWSCRVKPYGDTKVCQPLEGFDIGGAGDPCLRDAACLGGTCKTGRKWAGGYCTNPSCQSDSDCHPDLDSNPNRGLCAGQDSEFAGMCLKKCHLGDCRTGYICAIGVLPDRPNTSVCAPVKSPPIHEDFEKYPFDVKCVSPSNKSFDIGFDVASDTKSFMPVVIGLDGLLGIDNFDRPNGAVKPTYASRNTDSLYFRARSKRAFASLNAPAPQHPIAAGKHRVRGRTSANKVCYWVYEETTPGTTIDLNFYFVGTGLMGLSAKKAPNHRGFQKSVEKASSYLSAANISVEKVRYFDVSAKNAKKYRFIMDRRQLDPLFALGSRPGKTADDALSLNVYIIMGITFESYAGVASAIAGPAGVHGTSMSGVAVEAQYLDSVTQARYGGEILAHEIGHYLGLYHTTDPGQIVWPTDPLKDTAECPMSKFPNNCPDAGNLMFPKAAGGTTITADQAAVLQAHPLSKE